MSARVRILLVNKKHPLFEKVPFPTSVYDLVDPRYKGQACIGNPPVWHHYPAYFGHLSAISARTRPRNSLKT